MVILNVEPWAESKPDPPTSAEGEEREKGDKSHEMFGFQDLASDYYQVLRQKERPAWCRFVWGIVIIILLIFTVFMTYQLIAGYLEYNSFVESAITWERSVKLPAITICSTNQMRMSDIMKAVHSGNEEILQEAINAMQVLVETSTEKDGYKNIDKDSYVNFREFEIQSFIAELGGTVDLFIGFSFFTVFQLIEISVAVCLTKLWKRAMKGSDNDGDSKTTNTIENSCKA